MNPLYKFTEKMGSLMSSVQSTPATGMSGLQNLGNTCYLNSALQCLLHSKVIGGVLRSLKLEHMEFTKTECNSKGKVLNNFIRLWNRMRSGEAVINPKEFRNEFVYFNRFFDNYKQQDAQEALSGILDVLHEDLNLIKKKIYVEDPDIFREHLMEKPWMDFAEDAWQRHLNRNHSLIQERCHGLLFSRVKCKTCGHFSIRFDPFSILSVSLPRNASRITLHDVLDEFLYPEKLEGDDRWYCSKCKTHRDAEKYMRLVRTPDLLIIHFKRFDVGSMYNLRKNDTTITFDVNESIDLKPYFLEHDTLFDRERLSTKLFPYPMTNSQYHITSILNHHGSSLNFGHYTSFVFNEIASSWQHCDDQNVRSVKEQDVNLLGGKTAYLVFLERNISPERVPNSSKLNPPLPRSLPSSSSSLPSTSSISSRQPMVASGPIPLPPPSSRFRSGTIQRIQPPTSSSLYSTNLPGSLPQEPSSSFDFRTRPASAMRREDSLPPRRTEISRGRTPVNNHFYRMNRDDSTAAGVRSAKSVAPIYRTATQEAYGFGYHSKFDQTPTHTFSSGASSNQASNFTDGTPHSNMSNRYLRR
eukprot:GDKJ01017735.1.p1 GENE.GDKJ01017735.1~~GDKJ01017735.1.p1  ORF type:complete len:600 (-),score=86.30 GDKJ01017735.1:83-1831(-)